MAYRDEAEPLANALGGALGNLARKGQVKALGPVWLQVAGAQAAQACRVAGFNYGTLRVEVETQAWLDALKAQQPTLLERLKAQLPGCARLDLVLRGQR